MEIRLHELFLREHQSKPPAQERGTHIEVYFIKVSVRTKDDVHIIQTCNLRTMSRKMHAYNQSTHVFVTSEVVQKPTTAY